jgi:enoyl-[acyl-carrier-protein] reductase (NADH)
MSVRRRRSWRSLDGAKLITGDVMYIDGGYHIID